MSISKTWRKLMRRLVYLRAEAMDIVEEFEAAVKEIEAQTNVNPTSNEGVEQNSIEPAVEETTQTSEENLSTSREITKRETREKKSVSDAEAPAGAFQEQQIDNDDEVNSHYKRLWKAIAKKTHPDVAGEDEELLTLYKAAAKAWEKKNRGELLDVAAEVAIDIESPHRRLMSDAEGRCLHYEEMIRKVKSSIAWQWRHAEEGKKKAIVDLILKSKSEKQLKSED